MGLEIILYSRKDCHLCDVAERVLFEELGKRRLTFRKIDVDSAEELRDRFGENVPVIMVDGLPAFKHRVNAQALNDYLEDLTRRSTS